MESQDHVCAVFTANSRIGHANRTLLAHCECRRIDFQQLQRDQLCGGKGYGQVDQAGDICAITVAVSLIAVSDSSLQPISRCPTRTKADRAHRVA